MRMSWKAVTVALGASDDLSLLTGHEFYDPRHCSSPYARRTPLATFPSALISHGISTA